MSKDLREILNDGDIVKTRNGKYFVFTGKRFWVKDFYLNLNNDYNEKLEFINLRNKKLDIIEIKRPSEREIKDFGEKIENTIWEKENLNMWGDMTFAEAHKEMFMAIANGEVSCKKEWLNKTSPVSFDYGLENDCFACEEAKRRSAEADKKLTAFYYKDEYKLLTSHSHSNDSFCNYCPLGDGVGDSKRCLNGLYDKFIFAKGFEKFKAAYEIANLEWKEE